MERAVALKKLAKILGKRAAYRIDKHGPTKDERAAAEAAINSELEQLAKAKQMRDDRYNAILAADAEYQNLVAAYRLQQDTVNSLRSLTTHYKITVGTDEGLFFSVKARADSWEEIFQKLEQKAQA